ncbi:hypothetical protein [Mangrovimonas aestuarii]|uniref:hypothetical protein n=1 Tax=Mangrovimonas aestuarii TaxID=3018443 RepID=UPI0023795F98|nr:hypothetical protein [Mangrovimonas aestuarii]
MKAKITLIVISIMATLPLFSQEIEISFYGNYVFDDSFDSYFDRGAYYDGKIKGGGQWGVGAEYLAHEYTGVELIYIRQDTSSPTYYQFYDSYFPQGQFTEFDLAINYIMLGGVRHYRKQNSPIEGFGGLMAGMVIANIDNPDNGNNDSTTKFSWGAKLGLTYWASSNFGIKLQTQLLSAVQAMGGGLYFSGYGVSTGVSSYSTIYQFSLGGGIVFKP